MRLGLAGVFGLRDTQRLELRRITAEPYLAPGSTPTPPFTSSQSLSTKLSLSFARSFNHSHTFSCTAHTHPHTYTRTHAPTQANSQACRLLHTPSISLFLAIASCLHPPKRIMGSGDLFCWDFWGRENSSRPSSPRISSLEQTSRRGFALFSPSLSLSLPLPAPTPPLPLSIFCFFTASLVSRSLCPHRSFAHIRRQALSIFGKPVPRFRERFRETLARTGNKSSRPFCFCRHSVVASSFESPYQPSCSTLGLTPALNKHV